MSPIEKQGVVTLHLGSIIYNPITLFDFEVNSIYIILTTNTVCWFQNLKTV